MAFPGNSYPPSIPIDNHIDDAEAEQTFALMCYSFYHYQCLQSVINDTLSAPIRKLSETLLYVKDSAYFAVYSRIVEVEMKLLSPQQVVDLAISHMGNYPKPASMEKYTDFMKTEYSVGSVLENLAADWINLRQALVNPSQQVISLRDRVIDCLKEVYYQHPEYKLSMELMELVKSHGVEVTGVVKAYLKACVIALQIQLDCIDRGFMELCWFVRNTEPFFIIDSLKGYAGEIFGSNNQTVIPEFQRKLNSFGDIYRRDCNFSLVEFSMAVNQPILIISGVNRAFNAITYLLMQTPIAEKIREQLVQASIVMREYLPATKENVRKILPAAPTNLIDAMNQYDMVSKEKRNYMGMPSEAMVGRWVTILMTVCAFLEKNLPHNPLIADCRSLADNALKMIGK